MECPLNTFSGRHVWRVVALTRYCRYCGIKQGTEPAPLARDTDPPTSKKAGEDMAGSRRQEGLKGAAVRALKGGGPLTSGEIADYLGLRHEQIWRRVSDLKNDGAIEAHGARVWHGSNKAQEVWWLTGTWEG